MAGQATIGTPTQPNSELVRQMLAYGADDMQRCYQCGTCSVVCPETPDTQAFPRKEMVWAQWGLTDRLLTNGDAWLCHQCNECSIHCPRDAKPGDLMAALRHYQIEQYSVPDFMSKITGVFRYLPLAFIPPILLTFFLVLAANIIPQGGLSFPDELALVEQFGRPILFKEFIDHIWIDVFTIISLGFASVVGAWGGWRFWKGIRSSEVEPPAVRKPFITSFALTIVDILSHRLFRLCKRNKARGHAHAGILWGFLLLFAATTGAFVYSTILGWELARLPWDPIKILGNLGGGLLLFGLTWVSWRRLAKRDEVGRTNYFDWYFVGILYAATITGFVVEILRYSELATASYWSYMVHLSFYFMLFTYLPFTKFAHIIYRTLALTHGRQVGRTPGVRSPLVLLD